MMRSNTLMLLVPPSRIERETSRSTILYRQPQVDFIRHQKPPFFETSSAIFPQPPLAFFSNLVASWSLGWSLATNSTRASDHDGRHLSPA